MSSNWRSTFVVAAIALAIPGTAVAAVATATADLHIRSGPGPQYPVIGTIQKDGSVELSGCLAGTNWCHVRQEDDLGWSYAPYLTVDRGEGPVVAAQGWQTLGVPPVTYQPPPGPAPAVAAPTGALIPPPAPLPPGPAVQPPPQVRDYVIGNPAPPALLEGEVVVGSGLPESVGLYPIPQYQYEYAYVNQVPVLVEPETRRVVYVY